LVIHGALDVAVYPEEVEDIIKAIPHAEILSGAPGEFAHNWQAIQICREKYVG
jgi:hypothetical protein